MALSESESNESGVRSAKPTVGLILRDTFAMMARSLPRAWSVWLVTAASATGTNLVDIIYGAEPGRHGLSALQIASVFIRVFVGVLWTNVASSRAMIGSPSRPWAIDRYLWQAVGVLLLIEAITAPLLAIVLVVLRKHVAPAIPDAHLASLVSLVVGDIFQFGLGLITFKLTLWPIARAIGARDVTFRVAWRRMDGATWPLIGAYILLVGPLFFAHAAMTDWAVSLASQRDLQLRVTMADGLLSAIELMFIFTMFNALYKRLAAR
jgi:hypothetical protein